MKYVLSSGDIGILQLLTPKLASELPGICPVLPYFRPDERNDDVHRDRCYYCMHEQGKATVRINTQSCAMSDRNAHISSLIRKPSCRTSRHIALRTYIWLLPLRCS